VAHPYTTAGSFTVTETVTDSSLPQQIATSSQTVTVFSSLTGNFGACASLPQGWNCGNIVSGAPSPTSAQIVSGVFESRQSNPGQGGSNSYYYSTTQKGTFPWSPCTAPAAGVIPTGITSVSANFTSLTYDPGSSPSADRYHIYIALYYWLPNGPVTAGGSTYRCLDTQVRVENIGGSFTPIGSTATYDPGDSFGWDNVTLQISPGQTGLLVANVANQCLQDLQAWGIPTNTPCQLAGIEIGTEGYQFQELDVNWFDVGLNVGSIPLSTSFTSSPSSPIVNTPVTFMASTFGGTSPYAVRWNFGDGSTSSGSTVTHTYAIANTYSVTETATDAASPSHAATSSQIITVQPVPPLVTSFTFLPATPLLNTIVTFTAVTTGGTSPYAISWRFGDGTIGTGASTTHTFTNAGSYAVTETATDTSTPTKTATATLNVVVYLSLPLSATFSVSSMSPSVGQTITFSATGAGGTSPYAFAIDFGDGNTATGTSASHAYSTATTYTATLTVADSASPQATLSKSITINVQGVAPALTVLGNQTVISGTWINFTVVGTSNSGGTITLSATGLPAGAFFDTSTGAFSWRPSPSQTGSYVITFTATDTSSPSSPTSKPMQIQVNQAAPGGSNGGNGGSGGSSNGGCSFCGLIPKTAGTLTLLVVGGLLGLVFSLTLLTFRARASLDRTKKRLGV
jgi:PKD repeat protein